MFLISLTKKSGLFLCLIMAMASTPAFAQPKMIEGYAPSADSVKLYYRIYGASGDTVLFLHGGPGGNLETPIETYLQLATNHVLVAYDQRGGGRSIANDTTTINLDTHIEDLEVFRKFLNIRQMTILGHSWGGTLALYYAHRYPQQVSRLILHGPMPPAKIPYDAEREERYTEALTALCRKRAEAAHATDINAFIEDCRKSRNISWWVQLYDTSNLQLDVGRVKRAASGLPGLNRTALQCTLRSLGNWDFRPTMREIAIPVLIVNGTAAWPPVAHLQIWGRTLPNAKLLLIPGAGHETAQFENPTVFFKAMNEFLSGGWPARSELVK